MQLNQQLRDSGNLIDLLAPPVDNPTARLRTFRDPFSSPGRNRTASAVTRQRSLGARYLWASRWEDATFAALGAAGLAAIGLALRVLS